MRNRILLVVSGLCLVAAYWTSIPDGKVRMVFCDVGQGDGAIVTQGTNQMLIDVGPDNGAVLRCLGRYLPFWDKTIEAVIISHGDSDHDGALAKVERSYRVENVYRDLKKNDVVKLNKIVFEVVSPEMLTGESNVDSVVGIVNGRVLMMGDATAEVEQKLVWRWVLNNKIDILKVSHHGSNTATSKELVEATKPGLVVISVGKKNKFGHPSKEVLDRLTGTEVKRTDVDGDIMIILD